MRTGDQGQGPGRRVRSSLMKGMAPLLSALLVACAGGASTIEGEQGAVAPAYPGSTVLRELEASTSEVYEAPDRDNSCPTDITEYGTNDSPDGVTRFFEDRGFARLGSGGPTSGGGYRWVGVREGDESSWRKADIASGAIAGSEDWETIYSLAAANCGT